MTASLPQAPLPPSFSKIRVPSPPAPFSAAPSVRLPQTVKAQQSMATTVKTDSLPELLPLFADAIAAPIPFPDIEAQLIPLDAESWEENVSERSRPETTARTLAASSRRLPVPPAPPVVAKPALPAPPLPPKWAAIALPSASKPTLGTSAALKKPNSIAAAPNLGEPPARPVAATGANGSFELLTESEPTESESEMQPVSGLGVTTGAGVVGMGAIAASALAPETHSPQISEVQADLGDSTELESPVEQLAPSQKPFDSDNSAALETQETPAVATSLVGVSIESQAEIADSSANSEAEVGVTPEGSEPVSSMTEASDAIATEVSQVGSASETAVKSIAPPSEEDEDRLTGEEIFALIFAFLVLGGIVLLFFFSENLGFGAGRRLNELPSPEVLSD